jgi:hypothetical protein
MKVRYALASFVLLCSSFAPLVFAQNSAPACSGAMNIMRVSEVKSGVTMDQFMAAVKAHQAWYKSHGLPDMIFAARVVVSDPKTKAESYSDSQVVTYHYTKSPAVPASQHDAAWDAYVKMYNDASTIKATYMNCVPASALPASFK